VLNKLFINTLLNGNIAKIIFAQTGLDELMGSTKSHLQPLVVYMVLGGEREV